MSLLDKTKIKPIPIQKTLTLINNFVISSTSFLNTFTENVETKISKISNKITELEILLAVLEAKLNSVPGLDIPEEESQPSQSQQQSDQKPVQPADQQSLPEDNIPQYNDDNSNYQSSHQTTSEPVAAVPAYDKSKYADYEKMLKFGVPDFVVAAKIIAAGLDPSVLGIQSI